MTLEANIMEKIINYFAIPGLKRQFVNFKTVVAKEKIINAICEHFKITKTNLVRGGNYPKYSHARYIAFMLLHKHTVLTKSEIGRMFNKDHTTVIHGIRKVQDMISINLEISDHIFEIKKSILG